VSERCRRRFPFVIPFVLVVFCAPLAAQVPEPLSPSELVFGEEIDVRVVNLEVVVEEGSGERVTGLNGRDFRVLVDGEEVGVEYFTEVAENRAVTVAGSEAPPAVAEGQAVATNYVLFVDDDHTHVTFRRSVLRGFDQRLEELPEQDRIAVVVQSRHRLEILSPFTKDRESTRTALAELDKGGRYGGFLRSKWRRERAAGGTRLSENGEPMSPQEGGALRVSGNQLDPNRPVIIEYEPVARPSLQGAFPPSSADRIAGAFGPLGSQALGGAFSESVALTAMLEQELRFSINAVVSTMRALDVPEGRKVLLLLAGNWPTGNFRPKGQGAGYSSDRELLDGLIDTANLLGYTVYPMDQQSSRPNMRLWQNLRYVARDTGGRAFMAGSNVAALSIVNDDTSDYYWLGFVPRYRRDDQAHDIRVEVLKPGVRVRSRRGYVDLSRRAEADMEAQRALLFPEEARSEAGPLQVAIGAVERVNRRTMNLPVTVYLPVGRFPALPYGDRFVQELQLRFAVVDRLGRQSTLPLIPLSLGGASEPGAGDVVLYRTSLSMRRKPHDLVVTVHDPLSRLSAVARVPVGP
jgi:VWFA-related protein